MKNLVCACLLGLAATSATEQQDQNLRRGLQFDGDLIEAINVTVNVTLTPTVPPGPDTCDAQGTPPFIEEDYVAFKYFGDFPIDNVTQITIIDEAFVIAYDDLINCTQAGAFREVYDAELIAFQPEDMPPAFLLRAGVFCNSCPIFSGTFDDCGVELFTQTEGEPVDDGTCRCDGPDIEEF
ncbi:MAG: hypothetical protein SGARI_000707, partial [Bacillariaceae sp.]